VSALLVAACTITAPGVIGVAGAQPATPASPEEASAHFDRGVKFFNDGDYVAAMVQFKRAYELDPNWAVLYNIGQTAREQRLYSQALPALERYLKEGGEQIKADRRARVEGWISELKEKVASVVFTSNQTGVVIAVDDVEIGKTPLVKPVVMDAGRRKITASKDGFAPLTRFIEVAGTEHKVVDLQLVSLTGSGPEGNGSGKGGETPPEVKHTPWPWVSLGVTGALGVATAVVGGLAISKKSDFDDELAKVPGDAAAIEDARSSAKSFALGADVLGGLTGAFAIVTVVAFVVDYTRKPAKAQPDDNQGAFIEPYVGPFFAGVHGAF